LQQKKPASSHDHDAVVRALTDNIKGFTDAIKGVFPQTVTQLCIVHQIRNSCK
jgi:putative transposase